MLSVCSIGLNTDFTRFFWFAGVLKPPPDVLNPGKRKISFDLVRDDGKGYFYGPSDPADESSTPSRTSTSKQSSGQEKFFYVFMNFYLNFITRLQADPFWAISVSGQKHYVDNSAPSGTLSVRHTKRTTLLFVCLIPKSLHGSLTQIFFFVICFFY